MAAFCKTYAREDSARHAAAAMLVLGCSNETSR